MKICPTCQEEYEPEFSYCTFDGIKLKKLTKEKEVIPDTSKSRIATSKLVRTLSAPRGSLSKTVLYSLLAAAFLGSAAFAIYSLGRKETKAAQPVIKLASTPSSQPAIIEEPTLAEETKPAMILAEMPREELLKSMPQSLLRRFQSKPDDIRVIKGEKGEYVVMVGSGGADRDSKAPVRRIVVAYYDGQEFVDSTASLLPQPLSKGTVAGLRGELRFDSESLNINARIVASSSSIISECGSCDRAYQQITLEWKDSRYREAKRVWSNDPYTAFYVTAEALEKRAVDGRARLFVDESLAGEIYLGFKREQNQPWSVQQIGDSGTSYELSNGSDRLIISVSRENDRWKAVRIDRKGSVN